MGESARNKPMECKDFVARRGEFGIGKEQHQCISCGGEPMSVCDNCGGDYHELPEQRRNCPSKRLNNEVSDEQVGD